MFNRFPSKLLAALAGLVLALPASADGHLDALVEAADGAHRSEEYRARNAFRHPVETLAFFGIEPDMTVVEVSPGGGGWYTEILAPYLRDRGTLYVGSYDPASDSEYAQRNSKRFLDKLAAKPEIYDRVKVGVFAPPDKVDAAPAGSADMVLTFRNFHGWMGSGTAREALAAMYAYLKPGGILGIVQHRGNPAQPQNAEAKYGYVREDVVIALANSVGFHLVEASEINANPLDTKDYPNGVWNLPPALQGGDDNRARYLAIGESDRMTLKFRKPE